MKSSDVAERGESTPPSDLIVELLGLPEEEFLITAQDKADLLLVFAGAKRATEVLLNGPTYGDGLEKKFIPAPSRERIISLLDKSKKPYVVGKDHEEVVGSTQAGSQLQRRQRFFVAQTDEDAKALRAVYEQVQRDKEAFQKGERRDLDYQIGLLYGYPESAVRAYTGDESLEDMSVLPEEMLPYMLFVPSQQSWRAEVELLEYWKSVVERLSPELARQLVEESQEVNDPSLN